MTETIQFTHVPKKSEFIITYTNKKRGDFRFVIPQITTCSVDELKARLTKALRENTTCIWSCRGCVITYITNRLAFHNEDPEACASTTCRITIHNSEPYIRALRVNTTAFVVLNP